MSNLLTKQNTFKNCKNFKHAENSYNLENEH